MESPSSRRGFSAELKRRNVCGVAVGYLIVMWLVLEGTDYMAVIDPVPSWLPVAVGVLMLLGFPTTLIVAWRHPTESGEY